MSLSNFLHNGRYITEGSNLFLSGLSSSEILVSLVGIICPHLSLLVHFYGNILLVDVLNLARNLCWELIKSFRGSFLL